MAINPSCSQPSSKKGCKKDQGVGDGDTQCRVRVGALRVSCSSGCEGDWVDQKMKFGFKVKCYVWESQHRACYKLPNLPNNHVQYQSVKCR